jgi:hypothetical protein
MPSTFIINLEIKESAEPIEKITDDSTYGTWDFRYGVLSRSLIEYKLASPDPLCVDLVGMQSLDLNTDYQPDITCSHGIYMNS